MRQIFASFGLLLGMLALVLLANTVFVVDETQQVIVTQFGKPVGLSITEPGLNFKLPFVQRVNQFEKRFSEWDGDPNQVPTRDKRFIWVDTTARWRISDPLLFFQRLRDEMGAQSRLDDILDGETRNAIANHDLIELVRSTNRDPARDESIAPKDGDSDVLVPIKDGRDTLASEVRKKGNERVKDLGIEILDFRFKRINYVEEVRREVYTRMISERQRIAEEYRSEGQGEAARISGDKGRQQKVITSEAYKEAKEVRGKADAEAADIYAAAYNADAEFYTFLKTMELYKETLGPETELIMSTGGDYLRYLSTDK
jgi:membrane protease subunit HflC